MSGPAQGPTAGGGGSLGIDVGTSGGEWVFKQDGMLFGPVPARVLLDKLYKGEVNGETPIAPEGGDFKRLREVPFFLVHVAKAEAKLRVDQEAHAHRVGDVRKGRAKLVTMIVAGVLASGGVAGGVIWAVNNRAFEEQREELADIEIVMDTPLIQLAAASTHGTGDEEFADYVQGGEGGKAAGPRAPITGKPKPGGTTPGSTTASSTGSGSKKPFDEENITESKYDQSAINKVIAASKNSLVPCLKDQAGRDEAFRGDIPFTFTIENTGKIGKLWIDKPGYKTGPFYDCMRAKLDDWKFPTFEGERPSVSLSFRVGK